MIIRGETTTQCFKIPYAWEEISKCFISYQIQNKIVLEKTQDQVWYDDVNKGICVDLTEEDTFAFPEVGIFNRPKDSLVLIQVKALTTSNEVYVGPIFKERLLDTINQSKFTDAPPSQNDVIIYDGGNAFGD